MAIRVAVAGARGRMGSFAVQTLRGAGGIEYVGGFARAADAAERVYDDIDHLYREAKPDVVVDFTTHPTTIDVAARALEHGARPVIGATGWSDAERTALAARAEQAGLGAMLVPNFSLGAALMMQFAATASRYFPSAEIIELHHDQKRDKPSGTARLTAERITARGHANDVPIHSVRLPGMLAHQEVLFGGVGEVLSIRHDSLSRDSFARGIVFAVRAVMNMRGLSIGLDSILGEVTF